MSPTEAAQLARIERDVAALVRAAKAQAMFGARPWVPMVIALLALVISTGAAVRVEYVVERPGGIYP